MFVTIIQERRAGPDCSCMHCDIEIHWQVCLTCNFRCEYCFHGKNQSNAFAGIQDTQKIIDGFNRLGLNCQINISGGEPFSYRNFVGLCKQLTERHHISVNTNLSYPNVYQFADEIDPAKVIFLNCSVNIAERERLGLMDDYIAKLHYLKDKGFASHVTYVMYPTFIKRFEQDYAFFKSHGIILRPKVFRGHFYPWFIPHSWKIRQLKKKLTGPYPMAYSRREKRKLRVWIERSEQEAGKAYAGDSKEWHGRNVNLGLDRYLLGKESSFKGRVCLAGKNFVKMNSQGDVYRCHNSEKFLGNLFEGTVKLSQYPQKCEWDKCLCPYLGYTYVVDNPEYRKIGDYEKNI